MSERETIAPEPLDSPDARALIAALDADILVRYPNPEDNFFELDPSEVAPGRGVFLVAREAGAPIGCGAVRRIDPIDGAVTAEIKRMYVAPAARGRGLAARVLGELEAWARAHGVQTLVLETGARQPEAIAVYTRAGFARVPRFGAYACAPESLCFGKALRQ